MRGDHECEIAEDSSLRPNVPALAPQEGEDRCGCESDGERVSQTAMVG
jgi:hypothetical protein